MGRFRAKGRTPVPKKARSLGTRHNGKFERSG